MTDNPNVYTEYIQRGGELVFTPPYRLGDAEFWGFALQGTQENLQDMCNRYLNNPRIGPGMDENDLEFRYRVDTDFVMLCADRIGNVDPSGKLSKRVGFPEPAELIFWVLTRFERRNEDGKFEFERFVWFVPYIFVGGSVPAIAAGREVYGMPKEEGWFSLSPDMKKLTLDVLVYGNGYPKSAQARLLEIQELNTRFDLWDWLRLSRFVLGETLDEFGRPFGGAFKLIWQIVEDFTSMSIRQVTLKQFRDVRYGKEACYQAVVESPFSVSRDSVKDFEFILKDYRIRVKNYESHPIIADLGLKGDFVDEDFGVYEIVQKPLGAIRLLFDFSLGRGEVLWRSEPIYEPPVNLDKVKDKVEQQDARKPLLCRLFDIFLPFD